MNQKPKFKESIAERTKIRRQKFDEENQEEQRLMNSIFNEH